MRFSQVLRFTLVAFTLGGLIYICLPAYYSLLGSFSPRPVTGDRASKAKELAAANSNVAGKLDELETKLAESALTAEMEEAESLDLAVAESTPAAVAAEEEKPEEETERQEEEEKEQEVDAVAQPEELPTQQEPEDVVAEAVETAESSPAADSAEVADSADIAESTDSGGDVPVFDPLDSHTLTAAAEATLEAPSHPPPPPPPPPPQPHQPSLSPPPPQPEQGSLSGGAVSYDPKDHQLTPELVKKHLKSNLVMVTWANNHYWDFVQNWVHHVKAIGITNFMVGAMDNDLLKRLVDAGIPTFAMQSGMITSDFGWGTPNFHKMGRKKIDLIRDFTVMGFDILVSDVDTVWMRDPIPYFQQFPEADILTSSDHLATSAPSGELEDPRRTHSPANIGIMLIRHTAKELTTQWVEKLRGNDLYWDQNAFNDLMRLGGRTRMPDKNRLFAGFNGKLKIGILPVGMFCSGHTYFIQRMHKKHNLQPYVVHATFQFSGTEGKRHRMRETMQWMDPPEYYNHDKGFLVYNANVPQKMIDDSASLDGHFALVNFQLIQIRSALALAQSMGRVLIMPQLWCGFDRWWAPHQGKIPGSQLDLPFQCPMDHIFEVETWLRPRDENHFGKLIEFRESSFLQNPRTPLEVKGTVMRVEVCSAAEAQDKKGCLPTEDLTWEADSGGGRTIRINSGVTDTQAAKLHEQLKDFKVVQFASMDNTTFGGFESKKASQQFQEKLKNYAGLWCCKHAHPGHIWYDMWYDALPHTDRHNRVWNESWYPKTGP